MLLFLPILLGVTLVTIGVGAMFAALEPYFKDDWSISDVFGNLPRLALFCGGTLGFWVGFTIWAVGLSRVVNH